MQQHLTVILPPQSFHHHSTLGHLASTQYLYFVLIALSCAITLSIRFSLASIQDALAFIILDHIALDRQSVRLPRSDSVISVL